MFFFIWAFLRLAGACILGRRDTAKALSKTLCVDYCLVLLGKEQKILAQESIFDELKDDLKFSFLFVILDLYRQTPDIKPSRVIESLESEQIKGYFSEAVVAGLELSEKNALKLVNDCMDILLKNQKDREQTLKDKYNVSSITPAERRDLQQIILKKQEITDDDRNWLKKLSSKQD